jgi:ABC-type polysaccharide/polyol phosphate export permease
VDFSIALSILIGMMFSCGLMLTLNVQDRDFLCTVPFLIQILFYASPAGYPASMPPSAMILVSELFYFKKMEQFFADLV